MALCRVEESRMYDDISLHELYYALQHVPRKSVDNDLIREFTSQWSVFYNLPADVHRVICESSRLIRIPKGTIICHKVRC